MYLELRAIKGEGAEATVLRFWSETPCVVRHPSGSASKDGNMVRLKILHTHYLEARIVHQRDSSWRIEYVMVHSPIAKIFNTAGPKLLSGTSARVFCQIMQA